MRNFIKILPMTYAALDAATRPERADQPEALPFALYDTKVYPAAGAVELTFFDAAGGGDENVTNHASAQGLERGNYLVIHRVYLDALVAPSLNAVLSQAGVLNDLARVLKVARARWSHIMGQKTLGPVPATLLGRSGGAVGSIAGSAAPAAGAAAYVQSVDTDDNGGLPVNGSIVLPPATAFRNVLRFAPGVAVAADVPLRLSLFGVLYRPVR